MDIVALVAKAIAEADDGAGAPVLPEDRIRSLAAIRAMRVPSDEMIRAAHKDHEGEYFLPVSLWQSMIDAALADGEQR